MTITTSGMKKFRKLAIVAVACAGFSGMAMAEDGMCLSFESDRECLAGEAVALALRLRCVDYRTGLEGSWVNPSIWQYKPKRDGNGCEVHYKLSKLLDEEAQEKTGGGKGKANNTNRGVASALLDNNDQYAIDLLQEFMDTITYNAKLNPEYGDAQAEADMFVLEALDLQSSIGSLQ